MSAEINPYASPQEPSLGFGPAEGSGHGGAVTYRMRTALKQTRPWVTFLAILGFIGGGLMLLGGVGMAAMAAAQAGLLPGIVEVLVFLVMSAVYLALAGYLFRYGRRIRDYLRGSRTLDLELALEAQKSFWKMLGIVTIVVLALYALILTVGFAAMFAFGTVPP